MKTKLALACLSFIASNSYPMVYLEDEEDGLRSIDQEIAQAWDQAYTENKKTAQNTKPRQQYPIQEEQEDQESFA